MFFPGFKTSLMIVPQSITETATVSSAVDTAGFEAGLFILHLGAVGAADFGAAGILLQGCDTSGGTYESFTHTTHKMNATSNSGTATGFAFTASTPLNTDDNGFFCALLDFRKTKLRYIKANIDPGNAATLVTCFMVLFNPEQSPNTYSEFGCVELLIG